MCGICGFTGFRDDERLSRMVARLVPRGPDDEGSYVEGSSVSLAMRRLSVIDLAGGHQPIWNETRTACVVMNGEIYNYQELRDRLIARGHRFSTQSDTEVVVHLYEDHGEGCVEHLRGMFAFALWDRERETLLLGRDRLGVKPLHYAVSGEGVVFASELPALISGLDSPSLRPQAIAQYLNLLYVPGPGTVFAGVQQLLPGEFLRVTQGQVEVRRYFTPESCWREAQGVRNEENPLAPRVLPPAPRHWDGGSVNDRIERFRDLLRTTVRAHLISDVPLGLFLSGGLDSGAILAMMRAVTNGPIRSFSIGYDAEADRSYDELDAARALAQHFGTDHTEERLRPDVVKLLTRIVEAMGEPFADSSAIPTYLVSELARRTVTVALSGIGGDELFGGYPRHLGAQAAAHYAHLPIPMRTWVATRIAPWLPEGSGGRDQVGRLKRFLRNGHLAVADQYLRWVTFLPPEWGNAALTPEFLEQVGPASLDGEYQSRFDSWPSHEPADRAMGLDLQTYLPDDLLRMGDRLSMAHSLELRVPFCDHELLAFALALPAPVRLASWKLKGFMREALRGVLPPPTLARSKFGFRVPLARWLREELREMVSDLLSDDSVRRRGIVKPEYVRWVIREHQAGKRNLADQLYALLVLELWLRSSMNQSTVLQ